MAELIKPKNDDHFFLWDKETGGVIPVPIQPKDLGEIIVAEETIGNKNAKQVFRILWEENTKAYSKFLSDRGLTIHYERSTNEIYLTQTTIRTVNPVSSAGG